MTIKIIIRVLLSRKLLFVLPYRVKVALGVLKDFNRDWIAIYGDEVGEEEDHIGFL